MLATRPSRRRQWTLLLTRTQRPPHCCALPHPPRQGMLPDTLPAMAPLTIASEQAARILRSDQTAHRHRHYRGTSAALLCQLPWLYYTPDHTHPSFPTSACMHSHPHGCLWYRQMADGCLEQAQSWRVHQSRSGRKRLQTTCEQRKVI